MCPDFDKEQAKASLSQKEEEEKLAREQFRLDLLKQAIDSIRENFSDHGFEVILVGSITQPNRFSDRSDIDIVLKGFNGDRFEVWTHLERLLNRQVEVIIYEKCHCQEHIDKEGLKVI